MKFIGKLLITILIALLIAIVALYFLVQTRWGAGCATARAGSVFLPHPAAPGEPVKVRAGPVAYDS
jgi:hypothetical protein